MGSLSCSFGDPPDSGLPPSARVSFGGASLMVEVERVEADGPAGRKIVIGVEEFASCRFRRGMLADRLHLRASSQVALGSVPGAYDDRLVLSFAKHDRTRAEHLAKRIADAMQAERPS